MIDEEAPPPQRYAASLSDSRGRWFTAGAITTALLSLPTQLLFERGLGVDGYARWLLANSLVQFFVPIACFGYTNLILSEYFDGHLATENGRRDLRRFFQVTTAVAVVGMVAVYGFWPFRVSRSAVDVALGALLVLALAPVNLAYPLFQIHDHSRLVALWNAVLNLNRFLIAVATLVVTVTVTGFLTWWLAATIVLVVFVAAYPGLFEFPPLATPPTPATLGTVRQRGLRFGFAEYLDSLDMKLAIPVAATLALSTKELSAVGIALLLLNAIWFLPYMIVARFLLPAIHSRASSDRAAVRETLRRWMVLGSTALLVGAVACAFVGHNAVELLVKGDYTDQGWVFRVVGFVAVPLCLSTVASAPFLRVEHARHLFAWRAQSTLLFLLVTIATASFGAFAPLAGLFAGRAYLLARLSLTRAGDV